MNYFEFYEIPVSFRPDPALVKKKYIGFSKKYHPDLHALEDEDTRRKNLEMATFNTLAFNTLKDPTLTLRYVLQLKGLATDQEKFPLPPAFLMQMMELNEALTEAETDGNAAALQACRNGLDELESALAQEVEPLLRLPHAEELTPEQLQRVSIFYYKQRYLLRIQERINKFAPL